MKQMLLPEYKKFFASLGPYLKQVKIPEIKLDNKTENLGKKWS